MKKENIVVKKAIEFALEIIVFCELLEKSKKYVIAKQLLKSGTSIGANIHEAQNAESKADFIHKMKIILKELLILVHRSIIAHFLHKVNTLSFDLYSLIGKTA